MVVAGTGPAEASLKRKMPDAVFLGWIDPSALPAIYSSADLLVLPSRFDTFSCAVIEALACGLPVVAYNSKGPKDIVQNGVNGYLVPDRESMINAINNYFNNPFAQKEMPSAAIKRSKDYLPDPIIYDLLVNTGLI